MSSIHETEPSLIFQLLVARLSLDQGLGLAEIDHFYWQSQKIFTLVRSNTQVEVYNAHVDMLTGD